MRSISNIRYHCGKKKKNVETSQGTQQQQYNKVSHPVTSEGWLKGPRRGLRRPTESATECVRNPQHIASHNSSGLTTLEAPGSVDVVEWSSVYRMAVEGRSGLAEGFARRGRILGRGKFRPRDRDAFSRTTGPMHLWRYGRLVWRCYFELACLISIGRCRVRSVVYPNRALKKG